VKPPPRSTQRRTTAQSGIEKFPEGLSASCGYDKKRFFEKKQRFEFL
jgi:hypothetical protein